MAPVTTRSKTASTTGSCICKQSDNDEMIACEKCAVWFHCSCVGVQLSLADREPYQCDSCVATRSQKTTRSPDKGAQSSTSVGGESSSSIVNSPSALAIIKNQQLMERFRSLKASYDRAVADNKLLLERQNANLQTLEKQQEMIANQQAMLEDAQSHREAQDKEVSSLREIVESLRHSLSSSTTPSTINDSEVIVLEEKSPVEERKTPEEINFQEQLANFEKRQEELDRKFSQLVNLKIPNPSDSISIAAEVVKQLSATVSNFGQHQQPRSVNFSAPPTTSNVFDRSFVAATPSTQFDTPLDRLAVTMNRQYLRKLPTFSGDEREWPSFITIYDSTTLEGHYSEADNLNRLREALRSPALDLVIDLIKFSTTATPIIEELRNAYGRPEKLVVKFMDKLLASSTIKFPTDVRLRQFAIDAKDVVANLKAMGRQADLHNTFALEKLVAKLPFEHYRDWVNQTKTGLEANLDTFANFLMEKVKEIPPALFSDFDSRDTARYGQHEPSSSRKRVNAHRNADQHDYQRRPRNYVCVKCKGNHGLWRCVEFKDLSADQRWAFVKNRACVCCLNSPHHEMSDCPRQRQCGFNGCDRLHHRLLHSKQNSVNQSSWRSNRNQNENRRDTNDHSSQAGSDTFEGSTNLTTMVNQDVSTAEVFQETPTNAISHEVPEAHCFTHRSTSTILFKVVPVRIYSENESNFIDTFAFLDDGSSLTLLERDIFDELNLKGRSEHLRLQWTKSITRDEDSKCSSVTISGTKYKQRFTMTNVFTVENLDLPAQSVDVSELKERHPHLRGLPIVDLVNAKPKILIGLQHAKLLGGSKTYCGGFEDPIACKTMLGWTVYGSTAPSLNIASTPINFCQGFQLSIHDATKADDDLHSIVKKFFTTDNFGVVPLKHNLISEEINRASDIMQKTFKRVGDRYEIGLLWKSDDISLPDSYPMALKRLESEERSLVKRGLLDWKNDHIRDLVVKGYARVATTEELKKEWARVWYCPRFVIINPNKTPPKPRDVADVAARVKGVSLNTFLLKGLDNLTPLLRGLCKVRENAIAWNADVKEMFHQVRIIQADQQCQRFLWRDGDVTREPIIYIMQSMMFGPTCSPACAQYVKNTHALKYKEKCPEAVEALIKNTYVDDVFDSHATIDEAEKTSLDAIKICKEMGFDLVGFQSNNRELLERLPVKNVKPALISLNRQESEEYVTKILGMYWQSFPDLFTFKLSPNEILERMLNQSYCPTKREVLKTVMRIFDPLGLIAHYIIRGKIILQEIWREGTGWDEPIHTSLQKSWFEFVSELHNIEKISIPRHYAPVVPKECHVQLIVFVDASERAFAATAYFRFTSGEAIHVAHVMGKAKVAPIKKLTIPQLELQAAVMGVRLAATIKTLHSFKVHETKYLSDSKTTLAWICTKKYDFKTFVAVRVGEILDSSTRTEWSYIGTKENVADDATKWSDPSMTDNSSRWFKGPTFLNLPENQWPIKAAIEVKEDKEVIMETALMIHTTQIPERKFDCLDDVSAKFKSRWTTYVRVVAYMSRFCFRKWRNRPDVPRHITPEDFANAELTLFRKIQYEAFPQTIQELAVNDSSDEPPKVKQLNSSNNLKKLSPFIDEQGVIRMNTRSQRARTSYAARNPAILPNNHPLVNIFVTHYHEKNFHLGEDTTIADIREVAWIIDTRAAVRRIKSKCQWCKNQRAKPAVPVMGLLPQSRIDFGVKPFTHVGIDAFGPYEVKFGRGRTKRYGLILTCLTYRAVHIELLKDMTTDQCIMALRKFLARRGQSSHFYSDNGKNFVGARNTLHKDLEVLKSSLGEEVAKRFQISWHFQPAYSPWFGGAWERLIQSIKRCVDFLLKEEVPREDVLENALVEAELMMNRRPLTHVPVDHEDENPLTPYMALHGDKNDEKALAPDVFTASDAFSSRAYRRAQHLANKFMNRWIREYLPEICRREKWHDSTRALKVGDVVIVTEPNEPRNAWKKGRVVKVHPGPDNEVRAADVVLSDGTLKPSRSTGRLAVLDVSPKSSSIEQSGIQTPPGMSSSNSTTPNQLQLGAN